MKNCFLCGYKINLCDGTKAEIRKKTRRVHTSCLENWRERKHLENLFKGSENQLPELFDGKEYQLNVNGIKIRNKGN